jgi:hypothetical protein
MLQGAMGQVQQSALLEDPPQGQPAHEEVDT